MSQLSDDTVVISIDPDTEVMVWTYNPSDTLKHKSPSYATPETIKRLANSLSSSIRALFNQRDEYVNPHRPPLSYRAHPPTMIFPTPTLHDENEQFHHRNNHEIKSQQHQTTPALVTPGLPPPLFVPAQVPQYGYDHLPTPRTQSQPTGLRPSPQSVSNSTKSLKPIPQPLTPTKRSTRSGPGPVPLSPSTPSIPVHLSTVQQSPLITSPGGALAPQSLISTTITHFLDLELYINSSVANLTLAACKMDLLTKQVNLMQRRVEYNTRRMAGPTAASAWTPQEQLKPVLPDLSTITMLLSLCEIESAKLKQLGDTDESGTRERESDANHPTTQTDDAPTHLDDYLRDDDDPDDFHQGMLEMYTGEDDNNNEGLHHEDFGF